MTVIKTYIPDAERFTGGKLLYWWCDGGGEFVHKTLVSYFTEKGIVVYRNQSLVFMNKM